MLRPNFYFFQFTDIMNYDGSPTVRVKKLSGSIIQVILIWYIRISEIRESYDLVRMIFKNNFKITDGINYESPKIGNEFELAKVIFNLRGTSGRVMSILSRLLGGRPTAGLERPVKTAYLGPVFNGQLLDRPSAVCGPRFYPSTAAKKINLPIVPIEFYAEYLTISGNKRRSITKTPSVHRTPPKSLRRNSAVHSASYFISPLQKATLNSPKEKQKKQNDDEILIEKKILESRQKAYEYEKLEENKKYIKDLDDSKELRAMKQFCRIRGRCFGNKGK
ncbi:hypothetical protein BpHYR1_053986 [Brachionus plicatilis]|uniref:Uncharacterized protein n=1 Tax=Brachionus plicatilis TaxID=10195 RepID=A0A3M7PVB7_BRAPC|nr:hypothetical protein BpHYR1_053986 [Brachionus plicatilis]